MTAESEIPAPKSQSSSGDLLVSRNPARYRIAIWCFIALAATAYLVQCFTPLRLTTDAIYYLSIGLSAAEGHGFRFHDTLVRQWPPGYPAIIAVMRMAGLGNSVFLNLLNVLGMGVGLLALYSIARRRALPGGTFPVVVLAFAYSYVVVKHTALPLSDLTFFGVTILAVAAAESAARSSGRKSVAWWAAALVLAAATVFIRYAGIAIVMALLFESWRATRQRSKSFRIGAAAALALVVFFVAAGFGKWTMQPKTKSATGSSVKDAIRVFTEESMVTTATGHLPDLGQLVLNVPQSRLPAAVRPGVSLVGFMFLACVAFGIIRSRHWWSPARTVVIFYSVLIYLAPYTPGSGSEPRYWLPVFPFMVMELISLLASAADRVRPVGHLAVRAYAAYFLATGLFSLAYSDVMTFSQKTFLDSHAVEQNLPEYKLWLLHEQPLPGVAVDADVVHVLRAFGGNR